MALLAALIRLRIRRNDDLNLEVDQLISQGRKPVGLTFSESGFDGYILSLNVTERTEPCRQCSRPMRGTGKSPDKKTYPVDFPRRLRLNWKLRATSNGHRVRKTGGKSEGESTFGSIWQHIREHLFCQIALRLETVFLLLNRLTSTRFI